MESERNSIDFIVDCDHWHPTQEWLNRCCDALDALGCSRCSVSLVLTTDDSIKKLNREWRHKDTPTDVLSFPMYEVGQVSLVDATLGDIVISVDTAKRQAVSRQHPIESELTVLFVHGLCHLMGHNHGDTESAKGMARLENQLVCVMTEGLNRLTKGLIQTTMDAANV